MRFKSRRFKEELFFSGGSIAMFIGALQIWNGTPMLGGVGLVVVGVLFMILGATQ